MNNLDCSLIRLRGFVTSTLIAMAAAGCAAVAPLDDATLFEVRLASTDDLVRYAQAQELRSRELFAGASFSNGKGHILAMFTAAEYDKYLAYTRDHPIPEIVSDPRREQRWPMVRLSFQLGRAVYLDPDEGSTLNVQFYLCDAKGDERHLAGFGMPELIWRNHFVTPQRALEIEKALQTEERPQEYEVFFPYVYWDDVRVLKKGERVMLLPLPGDLCIALHRWNYPLPSSVGRPMRIGKDVINTAIGSLPRLSPAAGEKSN